MLSSESCTGKAFHVGAKKSPARLWTAGLYKGWVSKHNPYTILKRIFATKKNIFNFF
ncbi:MAG: hypothetical protein JWQ38_1927 [Flavipsychrobacter sp.]|nr:hypothetical protein [Flavipsychrobacter sp.]